MLDPCWVSYLCVLCYMFLKLFLKNLGSVCVSACACILWFCWGVTFVSLQRMSSCMREKVSGLSWNSSKMWVKSWEGSFVQTRWTGFQQSVCCEGDVAARRRRHTSSLAPSHLAASHLATSGKTHHRLLAVLAWPPECSQALIIRHHSGQQHPYIFFFP